MNNQSLPCIPCIPWFNFPEVCRVNQRIAKALFADNGPLTPADRRTFKSEIEEAVCAYVLKPDNVFLNPWSDGEHEYDSFAVIEISLRKIGKAERIAELFHRTMPYPLLLILNHGIHGENGGKNISDVPCSSVSFRGSNVMFSMAEKRISRDGKEQVVLEEMVNTSWWNISELDAFFSAADFQKFRKNNFQMLYCHYREMLEALSASAFTGELCTSGIDPVLRRRFLAELHQLNRQLADVKAKAKKESEMARLIDLNMQAKKINHEIHEIHEKLKENHE